MNDNQTEKKNGRHVRFRSLLDFQFPITNGKKPDWPGLFFMCMTAAAFWWIVSTVIKSIVELTK